MTDKVFANVPKKDAVMLHKGECRFCNEGKGPARNGRKQNWKPFESEKVAIRELKKKDYEVLRCSKCW